MAFLCFRRDRALSRFVDGELPLEEYRRLQAHVRACSRCAARVEAFRRLDALVAAATLPPVAAEAPPRRLPYAVAAGIAALLASLAANVWLLPSRAPAGRAPMFTLAPGPSHALTALYPAASRQEGRP